MIRAEYCAEEGCGDRIWLRGLQWVHEPTKRPLSKNPKPHAATPRPIRSRDNQQ